MRRLVPDRVPGVMNWKKYLIGAAGFALFYDGILFTFTYWLPLPLAMYELMTTIGAVSGLTIAWCHEDGPAARYSALIWG